MESLRSMGIFVKVAETGSLTKAAQQLHLSVSSVSVIIAKLEEELQVKLLNRTTRSLALTDAGKVFYRGCCRTLEEARQAHEAMFAFNNNPGGTLRVGCSPTMAQYVMTQMSSALLKAFPGLSVNLVTGIPAPDLISNGLDVIVRFGDLESSGLYSRRIGTMPMVVCAARRYLEKNGAPAHPADLIKFDWLEYSIQPDNTFELVAPDGGTVRLAPKGRHSTNDPLALINWLREGDGIAFVPVIWVMQDIIAGETEVLFPLYHTAPRPVYALYTAKDMLPVKVKTCIDYLTEFFDKTERSWQRFLEKQAAEIQGGRRDGNN